MNPKPNTLEGLSKLCAFFAGGGLGGVCDKDEPATAFVKWPSLSRLPDFLFLTFAVGTLWSPVKKLQLG